MNNPKRFILNAEELIVLANAGYTVNQASRHLKHKSDGAIRQFLKTQPELSQKFLANGAVRKNTCNTKENRKGVCVHHVYESNS